MPLSFVKMHGLGNDFVVIDRQNDTETLSDDQIRQIADRRYGVGCDQILLLEKPESSADADIFMRIYNPDGTEAGACGNGTRAVARLWMDRQSRNNCKIQTKTGLLQCERAANDMITVDMGMPKLSWEEIPLSEERDTLHLGGIGGSALMDPVAVNMGNPHVVFFVDDPDEIDIAHLGAQIERHVLFPERTNVEFAAIAAPDKIRVKVWERGTGITQACGSGACATAVAAVRRGLTGRKTEIILDGGSLLLEWRNDDNHILMTGPASYVFEGTFKV